MEESRPPGEAASSLGFVVIGRNEGERMLRCLRSLAECGGPVVYVDSGSSDHSPERARELGAQVVELDPARPFTAARGRNEGFRALSEAHPQLAFVQFLDGDTELAPGWIDAARATLESQPECVAVCGRRRERHPDASRYNRLIDLEWDTPIGEAQAFGGDVLVRASWVASTGGYDESLIAGEDPEFAHRLRLAGGRILRLDREMTRHDAALQRFSQWWRRQVRAGHAYAELVVRQRRAPDRRRVRHLASVAFWGGVVPCATVASALLLWAALAGLAVCAYAWLAWRIYRDAATRWSASDARLYAAACVVSKFAELWGALGFAWNRVLRGRPGALIEYKGPEAKAP
ncbi:MAG: glycosyltransferase [Proteobacteria bacterium]|nr:glycosyltransferase [Pseudomonadota bacterium]